MKIADNKHLGKPCERLRWLQNYELRSAVDELQ